MRYFSGAALTLFLLTSGIPIAHALEGQTCLSFGTYTGVCAPSECCDVARGAVCRSKQIHNFSPSASTANCAILTSIPVTPPLRVLPPAPATPPAPTQPGLRNTTTGNTTLFNPLSGQGNLESFLQSILRFVVRIGAIIVVLMMVYVGFLFVTAQGNDTKLTTARQALLWTVVGALILLGAQVIALGIEATVNALKVGQ